MTINERLKKLRKDLKKTLTEFGRPMGYNNSTVSMIELSRPPYDKKVDDRYIKAVCNAYNVSEVWLRTGNGDVFVDPPTTDSDESRVRWALGLFSQLTPSGQRQVLQIAREIVRVGDEKEQEDKED